MPKSVFFSPGSAIAYSAYAFPDALMRTTFCDYYVTLAVLNTIVSTGLSCYSRYLATISQVGRGRWSCMQTLGLWEGTAEDALGSLVLSSTWTSCGWAGPASWAHSLCSCSGPRDREGTILGLMLCYCYPEILNDFLKEGPTLSLYTGLCKLYSWSCC